MLYELGNYTFMKKALLGTILLVSLACPLMAQTEASDNPSPTVVPSPTPVPAKKVGEGYFGLGVSSISVSPFNLMTSGADNLTLFSVRYWLSDQVILEALAGGNAGTQIGYDANNDFIQDPYWVYCLGLGVKTNLLEPADGLLVQTITRFQYLDNSVQKSGNSAIGLDQYQYLSVQAGIGFEYFLPFAKDLSVETCVNLEFDQNWETYTITYRNPSIKPTSQNPSTWMFRVTTPGFNLTNLSVHYYF